MRLSGLQGRQSWCECNGRVQVLRRSGNCVMAWRESAALSHVDAAGAEAGAGAAGAAAGEDVGDRRQALRQAREDVGGRLQALRQARPLAGVGTATGTSARRVPSCIGCGRCDRRCPFGVSQSERMAQIAAYFGA